MNNPQPESPAIHHHHIERVDKESSFSCCWNVNLTRNKQRISTVFSDSVHGGKQMSLQAAIKQRDEFLKQTDIYELLLGYRSKLRNTNKSGITRVFRFEKIGKDSPNSHSISWVANWKNEYGVRCGRGFSIKLYGETEAKQNANVSCQECTASWPPEKTHTFTVYTYLRITS